ncbi:hypothetical protein [Nocardiopsis tropica]|uniref:Uncharacterized protein n=1 Tax=Nocardiopsis tropica TaxID=109330 RepID=A0ABU7KYK3_9ACTN|nr:hypothetical protein [Nocardiopsis umidischolae]MEE2054381.1 hypothetical protein [Nocardiopsis umidischolae]
MTFEPTQPQDGVDPNMFTLIDPEAIPYPLTDVWSLNYAAETLRTGGENLLGGAEDMHSTWAGLQAHYVAPESETLFAAMDPVVTRGEDIQSDLATVADALEELAEAASTARSSLNTLRIEAQSFWNKHHDKKVWWLDKDDETDEWALQENIRLKDGVNTAWATFNEAENACATRISALFGGPSYASPDQAGGDDVLVYGLPTDAGERELPEFGDMGPVNDFTAWLGTEFHPSTANFSSSTGQAAWDNLLVDGLWGSAVGLVGLSGLWHPQGGWQITPSGRWENAKNTVKDGWMDTMTFIGVHDEQGWVADGAEGTRWDRWTTNIGASWDQAVEGHTAWSRHEEDLEYTGATSTINTATWFVALPVKIGATVLTLGPGGDVLTPSNRDGSYSDGDDHSSQSGGRLPVGPSSPLPQRLEEGSTPIGERFQHDLTLLRESLLDPDQYRNTPTPRPDAPSPTPNRPVVGDGGDQSSPTAPQRGDTPQGQGEGPSSDRPRAEGTDAPRRPDQESEALSPTTRPDTEGQRGDNAEQRAEDGPERRPASRTDDDGADGQGDDRPVRRDDAPREEPARPETATGGGEGGGDQPPRDRTATGGDDGDENSKDESQEGATGAESPSRSQILPDDSIYDFDTFSSPQGRFDGDGTALGMDPHLAPEIKELIRSHPQIRVLNLNEQKMNLLIGNLERHPRGNEVASMLLGDDVRQMQNVKDIVSDLKSFDKINSVAQELRLAVDISRSGIPAENISFWGKSPGSGEDLDVAVLDGQGDILRGYQAYTPQAGAKNPISAALRKLTRQLPAGGLAQNRIGVVQLDININDLPAEELLRLREFSDGTGINLHIHFKDKVAVFPEGVIPFMEGE